VHGLIDLRPSNEPVKNEQEIKTILWILYPAKSNIGLSDEFSLIISTIPHPRGRPSIQGNPSLIEMQEMDGEFMRMLQTLRDEMQGPLKVSSGLRCEDHNQMVSTSGRKGPHTLAKATDILISGERVMILFEKARQIGFSGSDLARRVFMPVDSFISTRCHVRHYFRINFQILKHILNTE